MEAQEQLAARHIALRERAGLTQEQEAKMAGVSPTTISGIESGKITRPHLKTLLKLARALGTDVGELRESGKVEAPPSPEQPPLNGFDLEERRDYESRVWERINLLERAAEQWQRFIDEGLYDLEKPSRETLRVVDAVSQTIVVKHAEDARALKAAVTPNLRERLERAERQYFDANLDFWARVENESRHRERRETMREWTARLSA